MKYIFIFLLMYSVQACSSKNNTSTSEEASVNSAPVFNQQTDLHTVTVLEVIQVANYTYLRVKEGESELWMAVPTISAKAGDILYYKGGMLMTKFESKELKRTFDNILFVDKIATDKAVFEPKTDTVVSLPPNHMGMTNTAQTPTMGSTKDSVKLNVKIEPAKNGISIGDLLKNPKAYEGKKIIVKGKVTKYTASVMGKNWVHIQDGTEFKGKFEIVITTTDELKDGDTATFEGTIILNKDLGYGYFFEVLMEDAKLIK
ncbi:MAG: GW dipeptide domain-containing protein [Sphingobacteriales bacterium]|nr:GW dipeptide domain-containing protein [Sphingobacteriales bacterium]